MSQLRVIWIKTIVIPWIDKYIMLHFFCPQIMWMSSTFPRDHHHHPCRQIKIRKRQCNVDVWVFHQIVTTPAAVVLTSQAAIAATALRNAYEQSKRWGPCQQFRRSPALARRLTVDCNQIVQPIIMLIKYKSLLDVWFEWQGSWLALLLMAPTASVVTCKYVIRGVEVSAGRQWKQVSANTSRWSWKL